MDANPFEFFGAVVPLKNGDDGLQVFEMTGSEASLVDLMNLDPEHYRASKVETPRESVLPRRKPIVTKRGLCL